MEMKIYQGATEGTEEFEPRNRQKTRKSTDNADVNLMKLVGTDIKTDNQKSRRNCTSIAMGETHGKG